VLVDARDGTRSLMPQIVGASAAAEGWTQRYFRPCVKQGPSANHITHVIHSPRQSPSHFQSQHLSWTFAILFHSPFSVTVCSVRRTVLSSRVTYVSQSYFPSLHYLSQL
jgi:hypothetical protein